MQDVSLPPQISERFGDGLRTTGYQLGGTVRTFACQRFGRPTLAKQSGGLTLELLTLAHGRMDLRYRFDAERLPEQLDHWPGRHRGALARIAHRQHAETAVARTQLH